MPAYVDLLNHEIEDAAAGVVYIPGDVDVTSDAVVVVDLDDGESDEKP